MPNLSAKDQQILNEWTQMQTKLEHAKRDLRNVLNRHGAASSEFNAARIDFEMLKEEFDAFEKEHHKLIVAAGRDV